MQMKAIGVKFAREIRLFSDREWRWDFVAYSPVHDPAIAIEVQGGIWQKSGHTTGTGITRDCEKANAASEAGYRLLFFTPKMIQSGEALATIERMLR